MTFRKKFLIALAFSGKSQAEFAKELGVCPAAITRVINGKTKSRRITAAMEKLIKCEFKKNFVKEVA